MARLFYLFTMGSIRINTNLVETSKGKNFERTSNEQRFYLRRPCKVVVYKQVAVQREYADDQLRRFIYSRTSALAGIAAASSFLLTGLLPFEKLVWLAFAMLALYGVCVVPFLVFFAPSIESSVKHWYPGKFKDEQQNFYEYTLRLCWYKSFDTAPHRVQDIHNFQDQRLADFFCDRIQAFICREISEEEVYDLDTAKRLRKASLIVARYE